MAALFLAGSAAILCAQDANSTNDNDSNAVTAPEEHSASVTNIQSSGIRMSLPGGFAMETSTARTNVLSVSNSSPAAKTKQNKSFDDGAIRIDDTGIHVAGGNGSPPVDISWGKLSQPTRLRRSTDATGLAAILSPFIFSFGFPLAIIALVFYFRHRQNQMMHETVRAMIDKGIPITPEVLAGLNARNRRMNSQGRLDCGRPRNRHLLPGLILTGLGLALTGLHPWHAGTGGKIILFIGLAFLVVWLVERFQNGNGERGVNTERKQNDDQQPPKI